MGSNGAALARELREKQEGHPPEGSPVADLQPGIGRRASKDGINEGQQEGITDGVGMGSGWGTIETIQGEGELLLRVHPPSPHVKHRPLIGVTKVPEPLYPCSGRYRWARLCGVLSGQMKFRYRKRVVKSLVSGIIPFAYVCMRMTVASMSNIREPIEEENSGTFIRPTSVYPGITRLWMEGDPQGLGL